MRTLRLGARGEDVRAWQGFLRELELLKVEPTGNFGEATVTATRAFQQAEALEVDGVAGNRTLGRAMQLGLDLAPDDPPLAGGPAGGVTSLSDAWDPPAPPVDAHWIVARDPRVNTTHAIGALPVPRNPPPPVGWTYWRGDVTKALSQMAIKVQTTSAEFPLGSFVQALVGEQLVAARVEWHDYQGATGKHGCFRGTSLFRRRAPG